MTVIDPIIVDMSAVTAKQVFKVPFSITRIPPAIGNKRTRLIMNNESGVGLNVQLGGGRNFTLIAGAETEPIDLTPSDQSVVCTVKYILQNQPVALLFLNFFAPGEQAINTSMLGNSPIGISGNVTTSNVQTLTNDGNPAPTTIIESTPSGQGNSSFSLANDGSGFWQILSANVLRKIVNAVRGTSVNKAVIDIGDAGDLSITTYHGVFDTACVFPVAQIGTGALPEGISIGADDVGSAGPNETFGAAAFINPGNINNGALAAGVTSPNYLPLAGGTMTGDINIGSGTGAGIGHITDGGATRRIGWANIAGGPESGMYEENGSLSITSAAGSGVIVKYNNKFNGSQDLFINSTNPAIQFFWDGAVSGFRARISTNTPTAGAAITWSAFGTVTIDSGGGWNHNGNINANAMIATAKITCDLFQTRSNTYMGFRSVSGNKLAEMKDDGSFITRGNAGTCFFSTTAFAAFGANGSFDAFDYAEAYETDKEYSNGTVVCPNENSQMVLCTHDKCPYALIVSKNPGFGFGIGRFSDDDSPMPEGYHEQLSLAGRVRVNCSTSIKFKSFVTSDGKGGVRPLNKHSRGFILGYALHDSTDGKVGILVRPMFWGGE